MGLLYGESIRFKKQAMASMAYLLLQIEEIRNSIKESEKYRMGISINLIAVWKVENAA